MDLTFLYDALSFGNAEQLTKEMDKLPVEELDEDTEKTIFTSLMEKSETSPLGNEAVKIVMDRWKKSDIDGNLPETPVYFLMQPDIPQEAFNTMIKGLEQWNYFFFVYEFIYQDSSPEVQMALNRLDVAYGLQDKTVYESLIEELNKQFREEKTYNHVVREHIGALLDKVKDYAKRPDWIVSYYGDYIPDAEDPELAITKDYELANVLPDAESAVNLMMKALGELSFPYLVQKAGKKIEGYDEKELPEKDNVPVILSPKKIMSSEPACPRKITEKQEEALETAKAGIKQAFLLAYNSATAREKVSILGDLADEIAEEVLAKDEFLFTILGPANPIYGVPIEPDSQCFKYGGCRMFLCNEFEAEDDFGHVDEDVEWFTGNCEYCHNKIAKKIYAVRRPLTWGGWKGCFCSFECLREIIPMNDAMNNFIVNRIEEQLNKIGIQDRIVYGEGEINNPVLKDILKEQEKKNFEGEFTKVTVEEIPKTENRNLY
jgi:hypothetical protein